MPKPSTQILTTGASGTKSLRQLTILALIPWVSECENDSTKTSLKVITNMQNQDCIIVT